MAFTGEAVSALRLVSLFPDNRTEFPVRAGAGYHIAVTAVSAYVSGAPYELSWEYRTQKRDGNDDFAGAEQLDGAVSSSHQVRVDRESSVQPGEPAETGARTRWWSWTAPESGAYTWRLHRAGSARGAVRPGVRRRQALCGCFRRPARL